jgi:hypothetical protein
MLPAINEEQRILQSSAVSGMGIHADALDKWQIPPLNQAV